MKKDIPAKPVSAPAPWARWEFSGNKLGQLWLMQVSFAQCHGSRDIYILRHFCSTRQIDKNQGFVLVKAMQDPLLKTVQNFFCTLLRGGGGQTF